MDTAVAIDRFLESPGLSDATRRAYRSDLRDFSSWLRRPRARSRRRRRARAGRLHGRARPGAPRARAGDHLAAAVGSARARPPRARAEPRTGRSPRAATRAPAPGDAEARRGGAGRRRGRRRRPARAAERGAPRARLLVRPPVRRGRRRSTSETSISSASTSMCAGRAGRSASSRSGRRRPGASALWLRDGRPKLVRGACDALFVSVRGRRLDTSVLRAAGPAPAPAPARLRDAPPRGRRRPADDPGAARARVALDDAGLQPRRRAPPAAGLRPRAPALVTRGRDRYQVPISVKAKPCQFGADPSTGQEARWSVDSCFPCMPTALAARGSVAVAT